MPARLAPTGAKPLTPRIEGAARLFPRTAHVVGSPVETLPVVAWFFAPYRRRLPSDEVERYCAMDDFTGQIVADGGWWSESECLGNMAVVKVKAAASTLATIAATAGFLRVPAVAALGEPLTALSIADANALVSQLTSLGYTPSELSAVLGADIRSRTLGDLLNFACTRRLRPRYDVGNDQIVLDGPAQPCRPVEHVDADVN